MIVNADRKGPKDLMDLAQKANAFKSLADSGVKLKEAQAAGDDHAIGLAQQRHDDNFQYLVELHDHDMGAVQSTAKYLQDRLFKGKAAN